MNDVQLFQGDCLDFLKTLPEGSVDAVITDPPYGISFKSNGQRFKKSSPLLGDQDTVEIDILLDLTINRHLPLAMFFSPYNFVHAGWRSVLVWSKGKHVGIGGDRETCWKRDFELIGIRDNRLLNGKRDSALLHFNAILPPPSGHVAEKPIALMQYLVEKLTQPDETVLDPFMGSGTTGVACLRTGRRFIGCEIDPAFFAIAQKRIAEEQNRYPLFERHGALPDDRTLFS